MATAGFCQGRSMLRAILAATAVAFFLIAGRAVGAPPAWFDEGTALITTVSPGADCSPATIGTPPFPCHTGDPAVNEGYVVYNGVAVKGSCAGADSTGYGANSGSRMMRIRRPGAVSQLRAEHARGQGARVVLGPIPAAGARRDGRARHARPVHRQEEGGRRFQHLRRRAVISEAGKGPVLHGSAPSNAGRIPKRLSVTPPQDVSFQPKRTCSRRAARRLTLDNWKRCTQIMGGRLNDPNATAWFAFAGPKQSGGRREVWLRARRGDELVGFGTGTIQPPSGGYGQRLVVNIGQLDLNTSHIELFAEHLRSTKRCRNGRRYRLELVTDAGTIKSSKKDACSGGGSPG